MASNALCGDLKDIDLLARANGFNPSQRVLLAIVRAARLYKIRPKELTAIGILETGLGSNNKDRLNDNGTIDQGIFQINTINKPTCIEYNLASIEGNAMCAAKLLNKIAKRHSDYLGRYHSKTPKHKISYQNAVLHVLSVQALNND